MHSPGLVTSLKIEIINNIDMLLLPKNTTQDMMNAKNIYMLLITMTSASWDNCLHPSCTSSTEFCSVNISILGQPTCTYGLS